MCSLKSTLRINQIRPQKRMARLLLQDCTGMRYIISSINAKKHYTGHNSYSNYTKHSPRKIAWNHATANGTSHRHSIFHLSSLAQWWLFIHDSDSIPHRSLASPQFAQFGNTVCFQCAYTSLVHLYLSLFSPHHRLIFFHPAESWKQV